MNFIRSDLLIKNDIKFNYVPIIHPYYYSPVIEENLPGGSYEAMKQYADELEIGAKE